MDTTATSDSLRNQDQPVWHTVAATDVLLGLESGADGLSDDEAARRLATFGPNTLERVSAEGPLTILWRQIDNPLIWVLLASSALAIVLGKVTDGLVVLAVVVLNSLIGFVQESRASRAIEALRDMVPEFATALRSGRKETVPIHELVPGDVVVLASGDKVPADLRLIASRSLHIEEAALTGESVPAEKNVDPVAADAGIGDRSCLAFGGTLVTYGTGSGVIVATGGRTELGRISTMLQETTNLETPLTRALASIGSMITVAIVVVSAVILGIGMWRAHLAGVPLGEAARETLMFAIALAVGAIPEGLPAIVTIALAIGVQRMARRRAIVRKLPAVETLGSTTVICSDKTGTLTRNEMTVQEVWTPLDGACRVEGVGYAPTGGFIAAGATDAGEAPANVRALLEDAALCSDATLQRAGESWTIQGDPTEAALVVAAEKAGVSVEHARRSHARVDAIPFESENQFMATLHRGDGRPSRVLVKGAPEALMRRCVGGPQEIDEAAMHAEVERMAAQGMRVLAIAEKDWTHPHERLEHSDVERGLRFSGLVGMIDPPRSEAVAAVAACQRAGIVVKMITGDHRATAQAIGAQLGLDTATGAISGVALARMSDEELRRAAVESNVFARVAPEQKLALVRALADQRHVVAMTGDGVNDAPALKQANIGVAMGITGTSVSKEAADVVLTDDNFATIVAAVEEGRRVYDNLIKSLAFVLPTNLGLAFILIYAVLFFPFDPTTRLLLLPIQPTQILWINLVGAVALALPLAFEAREPDVMTRPPRRPDEPILSPFVVRRTLIAAVLMTAGAVGLFQFEYWHYLGKGVGESKALAEAQTLAVTTVVLFQCFYLLNCRSLRDSAREIGFFSNPWIFVGIAALLLLQAAYIYAPPMQAIFGTAPLDARDLLLATAAGAVILPVIGIEKRLARRRPAV
jgi:Ca2+-transporting ATPase